MKNGTLVSKHTIILILLVNWTISASIPRKLFLNLMQKGGQDSFATHKLFKVRMAIATQLIRP
jgi:hypothetical protein